MQQMYTERGDNYLNQILSGKKTLDKVDYPIDPLVLKILISLFDTKKKAKAVFLGGRVFKEIKNQDGENVYSGLDAWREKVREKIAHLGFVTLDGVEFDLHNIDVAAGAGRAMLNILLSPVYLIEGLGRIGNATIQEAHFALQHGSNVGLIVDPENYEGIVSYLNGCKSEYPKGLPAYHEILELSSRDIICGYENVSEWLQREFSTLDMKKFLGRNIEMRIANLIMHYLLKYASHRPKDLAVMERIVTELAL